VFRSPDFIGKWAKKKDKTRKDGKVRQVIVRHIGMAKDEEELKHFIRLAEFIKAELENDLQPGLFSPSVSESVKVLIAKMFGKSSPLTGE